MIRLAAPCVPDGVVAELRDILASGRLVQGERVAAFEESLRVRIGVRHAIAVSSGTAALHLALLGLDVGRGDEVIVPAFTFPATVNVVEFVDARPVFVDVSLDDYCMDPRALEAVVTRRTRAILPVHEFGQPARMDGILEVAQRHGVLVIEDAACALGAAWAHRSVGGLGHVGCFSFHPRKMITTGEGGLITTDDDLLAARLRGLRNHGLDTTVSPPDVSEPGLNYRLTEIQAAIGSAQLPYLDSWIDLRRSQAGEYDGLLAGLHGVELPGRFEDRLSTYQTYQVLIPDDRDRAALIRTLAADGIEVSFGAHALNCLSYYQRKYATSPDSHPNATRLYSQGLALPLGPHLAPTEQQHVCECLERALRGAVSVPSEVPN